MYNNTGSQHLAGGGTTRRPVRSGMGSPTRPQMAPRAAPRPQARPAAPAPVQSKPWYQKVGQGLQSAGNMANRAMQSPMAQGLANTAALAAPMIAQRFGGNRAGQIAQGVTQGMQGMTQGQGFGNAALQGAATATQGMDNRYTNALQNAAQQRQQGQGWGQIGMQAAQDLMPQQQGQGGGIGDQLQGYGQQFQNTMQDPRMQEIIQSTGQWAPQMAQGFGGQNWANAAQGLQQGLQNYSQGMSPQMAAGQGFMTGSQGYNNPMMNMARGAAGAFGQGGGFGNAFSGAMQGMGGPYSNMMQNYMPQQQMPQWSQQQPMYGGQGYGYGSY